MITSKLLDILIRKQKKKTLKLLALNQQHRNANTNVFAEIVKMNCNHKAYLQILNAGCSGSIIELLVLYNKIS